MLKSVHALEAESGHGALRDTPEGRLWTSILTHSLKDLEITVGHRNQVEIERLLWFFFDPDSMLEFVCEELDYSLRHIRNRANEIVGKKKRCN